MKSDIFFNFVTAASIAVLTFVFTPIYVHYLGVEAFGLVGFLSALQASMALLDLGLSQVLARELARFAGGAISTQSIRDLLRSIEFVAWAIAAAVALAIALPSQWIAVSWLKPGKVPVRELVESIEIMGVLVGLRLLEGLYRGAVVGLNRQFALNVVTTGCAIARAFGALAIFIFVSRSIRDFFVWQALVSAVQVGLMIWLVYANLPDPDLRGSFSVAEFKRVWRFAAGLTAASLLGILLMQTDKLLLSKLLALSDYGEYALAATLAAAPHVFAAPIVQAAQPRLARAVAQSDQAGLAATFHSGAQLLTVFVGAAAIVIMLFSHTVLELWLHNPQIASRIAPLVSVLALGGLLNGINWLPFGLQLANGWTRLTVWTNIAAVVALVPGLIFIVPRYGALGAAWVWVVLNLGLVLVTVVVVLGRLLPEHTFRWCFSDVAVPLLAAAAAALTLRALLPLDGPIWQRAFVLVLVSAITLICAALAAPLVRAQGTLLWRRLVARR
jgi:O-antigen/teichoic acid export membrane protein